MPFKFGTKRVPIEVNNWWKFGVDISNHFWEIENWNFFGLSLPPSWKENNFQKLFSFQLGGELRPKIFQFLISQKWFEISAPNFHQLLTSIGTRFVLNLKGIAHLKRLPCPFEVLEVFGWKFKFKAPKAFIFGAKRVPIKVNNWWKFGANILKGSFTIYVDRG